MRTSKCEHVLDTFNALLRIARVESGAHRSAFAALDLERIVRDVCELYQAAADERQIELVCTARAAVEVFGDRELLAQALTNLLDNAVKYTPTGGRIVVTLERTEDVARIRVADSGPGVPAADRDRVLQRFTRLDQARSQPGNGLGLALVNAVTTQHHGRLSLARQRARSRRHDRDPGAGPVHDAARADSAAHAYRERRPAALAAHRVSGNLSRKGPTSREGGRARATVQKPCVDQQSPGGIANPADASALRITEHRSRYVASRPWLSAVPGRYSISLDISLQTQYC